MKWFRDMKIATKMLTAFTVVSIITGVVGGVGMMKIRALDAACAGMYERVAVPVGMLGNISTAFQRVRVNLAKILLEKDFAKRKEYGEQIEQLSAEITRQVGTFEKYVSAPEEKGLVQEFSATRAVFRPLIARIRELALAGREAEAVAIYNGDATRAAMAENEAINRLVNYKISKAKETAEENSATSLQAMRFMGGVIVAGILLAAGLGFLIARAIAGPLRQALDLSNSLATGDLTVDVAECARDETGRLLASMKEMMGKLRGIVADVKAASDCVATGSQQLSSGSQQLSQGATEQASAA